jgi:hypothetical protein
MNETVLTSTGSVSGTVVSTDSNGNVNCVVVGPTTFVRGIGGVFVPTDK